FTITGYQDSNSHFTVFSPNANDITQERIGRNVANDATWVLIDRASGTWAYPRVILKEAIIHYNTANNSILLNPANYVVRISNDETDFVVQSTMLAASFSRDQHFLNASNLNAGTVPYARLPFSAGDVTNWNTAYNRGDFRTYGLAETQLTNVNDLNSDRSE